MSSEADIFAPNMRFSPYWWDAMELSPATARDIPALPSEADVVVVGAGFTGLSAALSLAQAGRKVVVLDAGRPGIGASTRNGGMFGPNTNVFETVVSGYGVEMAKRIVADTECAYQYIKTLIEKEAIDCKAAVVGHYKGAMQPRIYESMARQLENVQRHVPYDAYMVPRSEQHNHIGTDLYHGGMVNPRHAGLHPGLYHEGLSKAAVRSGAQIFAETPVLDVVPDGAGFTVKTPRGVLKTRDVMMATNAYTGKHAGAFATHFKRRVIPIRSAVIATEPLRPGVMARLMPAAHMLAGSQRIATYYRPSPDGTRILFGGRVLKVLSTDDGDVGIQRTNAAFLHSLMVRVFPELHATQLTHYGQGQTAFTFDHLPHTGKINGIHYAMGYNGTGVARATWLGHQSALRILGAPGAMTPFEELNFRTRPLYYGRPWFLPLAVKFYDMRDKWDQRR